MGNYIWLQNAFNKEVRCAFGEGANSEGLEDLHWPLHERAESRATTTRKIPHFTFTIGGSATMTEKKLEGGVDGPKDIQYYVLHFVLHLTKNLEPMQGFDFGSKAATKEVVSPF
jgi:hypothetical protein